MSSVEHLGDALRSFVRERDWEQFHSPKNWAAAGFEDTLLGWNPKPEVVHGNETGVQSGVQA